MDSKIIVNGITLTNETRADIVGYFEKILRHHHDIILVRLDLHECGLHHGVSYHVAKVVIEIPGRDFVASTSADNLYKSVHLLASKADRYLTERARHSGLERRRPRSVDIPVSFPKAVFS